MSVMTYIHAIAKGHAVDVRVIYQEPLLRNGYFTSDQSNNYRIYLFTVSTDIQAIIQGMWKPYHDLGCIDRRRRDFFSQMSTSVRTHKAVSIIQQAQNEEEAFVI